jgi:hypothetical protein
MKLRYLLFLLLFALPESGLVTSMDARAFFLARNRQQTLIVERFLRAQADKKWHPMNPLGIIECPPRVPARLWAGFRQSTVPLRAAMSLVLDKEKQGASRLVADCASQNKRHPTASPPSGVVGNPQTGVPAGVFS